MAFFSKGQVYIWKIHQLVPVMVCLQVTYITQNRQLTNEVGQGRYCYDALLESLPWGAWLATLSKPEAWLWGHCSEPSQITLLSWGVLGSSEAAPIFGLPASNHPPNATTSLLNTTNGKGIYPGAPFKTRWAIHHPLRKADSWQSYATTSPWLLYMAPYSVV